MNYKETQYGFEYGAVTIERLCSDEKKGWVILSIRTPKHKEHDGLQIYVTKTGKIRFWHDRKEWELVEKT